MFVLYLAFIEIEMQRTSFTETVSPWLLLMLPQLNIKNSVSRVTKAAPKLWPKEDMGRVI